MREEVGVRVEALISDDTHNSEARIDTTDFGYSGGGLTLHRVSLQDLQLGGGAITDSCDESLGLGRCATKRRWCDCGSRQALERGICMPSLDRSYKQPVQHGLHVARLARTMTGTHTCSGEFNISYAISRRSTMDTTLTSLRYSPYCRNSPFLSSRWKRPHNTAWLPPRTLLHRP